MPSIILYFLKVSVSLGIVWGFYQLLLRRLTFYTQNRWYLLGYSALAFFIPLIDLGPVLDGGAGNTYVVVRYIPSIGSRVVLPAVPEEGVDKWTLLAAGMVLVSFFLLVRLAVRWGSLLMVRRRSRLVEDGAVKLYWMEGDVRPFSFGSAVYINPRLHTEKEFSEIILHEYVHIRQRHSVDILFAELLCIVCWYNPFVWLLRYSIRQNLEFIADRAVLSSGVDRKGYQYHLLKVVGEPAYRLANNFSFSSLKKRIIMMNKIRSARLHLVKFLFILPLIGVSLVAFRKKIGREEEKVYINVAGMLRDLDNGEALGGVLVKEKSSGKEARTDGRGYYRLQIPVTKDSARVVLMYSKSGYEDGKMESFFPAVKKTIGDICVSVLGRTGVTHRFFIEVPNMKEPPVNPSYADVMRLWEEMVKLNEGAGAGAGAPSEKKEAAPAVTVKDTTKPSLPESALYVVDGEIRSAKYVRDSLGVDKIYAMDVLKGESAYKFYGVKASNGAIVITTKAFKERYMRETGGQVSKKMVTIEPATVTVKAMTKEQPIYIIDGVEKDGKALQELNPDKIDSINVLKNQPAIEKYGEKGRNGVIIIHLKKNTKGEGKPSASGSGNSGGSSDSGISAYGEGSSTGRSGIGKDGYVRGLDTFSYNLTYKYDLELKKKPGQ